jgi:transposase
MLPVIEKFIHAHPASKPIVIADAAMLSEERLTELKNRNISYIVGARLANINVATIKQIQTALQREHGATVRLPSIHGDLICDFSIKRYKKDVHELNRQIKKAEDLVAKQSDGKRVKFVKKVSKQKMVLNNALIEKHQLLAGIKGYCTNIAEENLSNEKVIDYYHQLWRIEQSFRMSKSDLEARPVFHRKENAIRSHVLICFVALIMEKYLELTTKLSLREIRFLIWSITESHIQDKLTKEVFVFRSPTNEIMNSSLASLIKKWNLLPH